MGFRTLVSDTRGVLTYFLKSQYFPETLEGSFCGKMTLPCLRFLFTKEGSVCSTLRVGPVLTPES